VTAIAGLYLSDKSAPHGAVAGKGFTEQKILFETQQSFSVKLSRSEVFWESIRASRSFSWRHKQKIILKGGH
jgi:hypothetical protein